MRPPILCLGLFRVPSSIWPNGRWPGQRAPGCPEATFMAEPRSSSEHRARQSRQLEHDPSALVDLAARLRGFRERVEPARRALRLASLAADGALRRGTGGALVGSARPRI